MTKTFEYESRSQNNPVDPDLCALLEVYVDIACISPMGERPDYDIETIKNLDTNEYIDISKLPENEQADVIRLAKDLAHEYAREAYLEFAQGQEEWFFDVAKRMLD